MKVGDVALVTDVWKGLKDFDLTEGDTPEALTSFLQRNPDCSAVATVEDGQIVGTILAGHDGRRGYLYHVVVKAEFQRQGAGQALVDHALKQLHQAGITRCNAAANTDRKGDQDFWRNLGWTEKADLTLVQKKQI